MDRVDAEQQLATLAQAIRRGAQRRPATRGQLFTPQCKQSDAVGAAFEGTFGKPVFDPATIFAQLVDAYPVLRCFVRVHRRRDTIPLLWMIQDKTDWARLSREAIADWIEHDAINDLLLEVPA